MQSLIHVHVHDGDWFHEPPPWAYPGELKARAALRSDLAQPDADEPVVIPPYSFGDLVQKKY